jgi:disulfide bond formation protein DsbB
LIAEEEFCESTLVGAKVAAKTNRSQRVGSGAQLILLRFTICILIASGIGKAAERCIWKAPHPAHPEGPWEDCAEWYKFPANDVKNIFH